MRPEPPSWHSFKSDSGDWYATLQGFLTDEQLRYGLAMTVAAATETSIKGAILHQINLYRLWADGFPNPANPTNMPLYR